MRKALKAIEEWQAANAQFRFVTIENTTGVWVVAMGEFEKPGKTSTGIQTEAFSLRDAVKAAVKKARKAGWEL